ncbi:hypothetical protein ACFLTU_02770 [Bacteroidota bacterium]
MKINIDFNSKSDCYHSDQLTRGGSANGCTKKCRNRALLYLLLAGIAFLLAFALGYYLPSSIIRLIWVIISGTLVVLTGISVVIVVQCTNPEIDDACCLEESNSKNEVS